MAIATWRVKLVATFPWASSAVPFTGGVIATPDAAVEGWTLNESVVAVSGFTIRLSVSGSVSVLIVAEMILRSATVDASDPVAMPLVLVRPLGCVRVLPVPVVSNATAAPLTGLPLVSRAVTVMLAAAPPAVMVSGLTTSVDLESATAPAPTENAVLVELSAVEEGDVVPPTYDSMIAKAIAHGHTRDDAFDALAQALRNAEIWPVTSNAAMLANLLDN